MAGGVHVSTRAAMWWGLVLGAVAVTNPSPSYINPTASGAVLMGQEFQLPLVTSMTDPSAVGVMAQKAAVIAARESGLHYIGADDDDLGDQGQAVDKNRWTYANTNWEQWPLCRKGLRQSPVDLVRPYWGAFLKLQQRYQDQLWPTQVNDGRTIRVDFKKGDGSVLQIGDKELTPISATYHQPSMHKINGTHYDMEMQIIHSDTADNKVGLSVLMQVATLPADDFYIQNIFGHFFTDLPKPGKKRRAESMNLKWVINELMQQHYITYHGSLTSPPCTEGVQWFVLGRPWLIQESWLKAFKAAVPTPNIRPVQDLGGRDIESF